MQLFSTFQKAKSYLGVSVSVVSKDLKKRKKSRESLSDEDDEIENVFSHPEGQHSDLKVLKLITDAGLSLVDVITDFLFATR